MLNSESQLKKQVEKDKNSFCIPLILHGQGKNACTHEFMTDLLSEWARSAKNMEHFLSLVSPYGSEMLTLENFRLEDKMTTGMSFSQY